LGRTPDLLVNTHAHVDHFGGNVRLKVAFPELRIAAHDIDAKWIEDTKRHLHEFYMQMPDDWRFDDDGAALLEICGGNSAVDVRLLDTSTLTVGERSFEVSRTEGHSPGHITLFERQTGVAICGDAALGWGPATEPGTPDAPSAYTDADAYLAGADAVLALDATVYCTGHFGAVDRARMSEIVAKSHDFVASFDRWILQKLSTGAPATLHEVAAAVSAEIPTYEFGFHIHASVQANLARMLRAGVVRAVMINGRRHFQKPGGATV
jgi:glyoxylase-like metal-dependent hydrolase (beta-lactamase superfamily II)